MRKLIYAFVAALVVVMAMPLEGIAVKRPVPSPATVEMVKWEVNSVQPLLPIEGGFGMMIVAMAFDEDSHTINYMYQYTRPGVVRPSDAELVEAKKAAVSVTKLDPKSYNLIKEGIVFHYDYYSVDGDYLYSCELTSEDMSE